MFFEWEKRNSNKNYLVKAIGLSYIYYVMYSSTIFFTARLICLANVATPDFIIYHLEQNLTASCFHCWPTALTKRKLSMQCTIYVEVYIKEAWKPSLHIIAFTSGSLAYCSYHSSSFFIQLRFIPFYFSHSNEIARILQNS